MQTDRIFTRKNLHLASFWKWQFSEIGSSLYFILFVFVVFFTRISSKHGYNARLSAKSIYQSIKKEIATIKNRLHTKKTATIFQELFLNGCEGFTRFPLARKHLKPLLFLSNWKSDQKSTRFWNSTWKMVAFFVWTLYLIAAIFFTGNSWHYSWPALYIVGQ